MTFSNKKRPKQKKTRKLCGGSVDSSKHSSKSHKSVLTYNNGNVYEGQLKNDKKHGKGKMTYQISDENRVYNVYEGNWEYDTFKEGKMTYANGDVYEGKWDRGLQKGKGKMTYAKRDIYEGKWEKGDVYEGDWRHGSKMGTGTMTYANGDVYNGEWFDDKKQGKGKMTYANGDAYDGNWKNGYMTNGERKINGYKDGKGKMTYANGDVDEGYWTNDKFDGKN
jgi:hypothetical protein